MLLKVCYQLCHKINVYYNSDYSNSNNYTFFSRISWMTPPLHCVPLRRPYLKISLFLRLISNIY